jgi:hypothetical protein
VRKRKDGERFRRHLSRLLLVQFWLHLQQPIHRLLEAQ